MDLIEIKTLASELMGNKISPMSSEKGEKYFHNQRVAALVMKLRNHIIPDDDNHDIILTVATWFHDILNEMDDHNVQGAIETRNVLTPYCTQEELDEICNIISVHDDREPGRRYSVYIQLHQDADHLDHFGTFDVWRTFGYVIAHKQTISDALSWMANRPPSESAAYRAQLSFDASKRIFDDKMDFLRLFTDRFLVEGTGGIWDEERLLKTMAG